MPRRPGSQVARQGSAKPLYVGAIPAPASKWIFGKMPGWRNGIRTTLKMLRGFPHASSTLAPGTITNKKPLTGFFVCNVVL